MRRSAWTQGSRKRGEGSGAVPPLSQAQLGTVLNVLGRINESRDVATEQCGQEVAEVARCLAASCCQRQGQMVLVLVKPLVKPSAPGSAGPAPAWR